MKFKKKKMLYVTNDEFSIIILFLSLIYLFFNHFLCLKFTFTHARLSRTIFLFFSNNFHYRNEHLSKYTNDKCTSNAA